MTAKKEKLTAWEMGAIEQAIRDSIDDGKYDYYSLGKESSEALLNKIVYAQEIIIRRK